MRLALVASLLAASTACVISPGSWGDDDLGGGSRDSWTFDGADVDVVLVDIANGAIDVRTTPDPFVTIDWDGGGFGDAAGPDVALDADGFLRIDADGGAAGGGELYVTLPAGTGVGAWIDYGDVDVALDAPADVVACATAGDVRIEVPAGRYDLDLDTPVGDTQVEGIVDDASAPFHLRSRIGAGSLRITGTP